MKDTRINIDDIQAAEKIVGVDYSISERKQILNGIEDQILMAQLRRQYRFNNIEPMATRFDPRLPYFAMPRSAPPPIYCDEDHAEIPHNVDDIAFAPIGTLSCWIRNLKLSSRRLTEIYLNRIEQYGSTLNCFATVTADRALAEAESADCLLRAGVYLGPLHGIPYGIKDLFDTRGIVTGWGAEPFRDRIPNNDAIVVKRLRAAGAVMLGKTTQGALAYNDVWYGGTTKNPWNTNEGSSGSSAGSAAATGAALCGFSIGTDTMGSIVVPSDRCGCTGLRPSFGRIPRTGAMALSWTLDKVGPICRSVQDTAMVLAALNGADQGDISSINVPYHFDYRKSIDSLRIGYIPQSFGEFANDVDHNVINSLNEMGMSLRQVQLPNLPYGSLVAILQAEAAAAFEDLTLDDLDDTIAWQDDAAWPNTFRRARFLSAVDHVQLDRLRLKVMQALHALFEEVDVLVGPLNAGPMLVASSFTGHPCLHMRAGFVKTRTRGKVTIGADSLKSPTVARSGKIFTVPQGISLWGRLFDEGTILNVGMALEKKLNVATYRPQFDP